MGLPKFGFDYTVYAWETDSDCAFYNLGNPLRIDASLAETETASDIYGDTTYTIQVSRPIARVKKETIFKFNPVNLMFMNRYKGMERGFPIRVAPVPRRFDSFLDLYEYIESHYEIAEVTENLVGEGENQICTAQFHLKEDSGESKTGALTVAQLAHHLNKTAKEGVNRFRTQAFEGGDLFSSTFDAFSDGSDQIVFATWEPLQGLCDFKYTETVKANNVRPDRFGPDSDDDDSDDESNGDDEYENVDNEYETVDNDYENVDNEYDDPVRFSSKQSIVPDSDDD